MSKDARQIAALVQLVMRASKGKLSSKVAIALAVGVVLYAFLLQPLIEKKFGVSLPGIPSSADTGGPTASSSPPESGGATPSGGPRSGSRSDDRPAAPTVDPSELGGLLTEIGRGAYRSPAGLRYTRGSQQGHRLAHVMTHARDQPNRVGQHGVFGDDDPATIVRLVDEAYTQAQSGRSVRTEREGDRTVYTVDLGRRIGYIGGQSGGRRNHPSAEHMRLVVEGDRLITAFPVRP